ncbi:hypothetical protein JAAARDRAFT_199651 [Jaapia argillacea MUCL 33604]|uniref:Uncharacterized protein n=1 Tax=Jaapia argillacea MUCL 33604 TaxID=933084 RepID=A0A067P7D3_9AGAM|nr:hypothetical protein JAAARDRAFT_199651 [Jaapia argillacea MUCL 33604]
MFLLVGLNEWKKVPSSREAELHDFQNIVNLYRHLTPKFKSDELVEDTNPGDADHAPSLLRVNGEVEVLSDEGSISQYLSLVASSTVLSGANL